MTATTANPETATGYDLTIRDQRGQLGEGFTIGADPSHTPAQIQDHLVAEGALVGRTDAGAEIAYDFNYGDRKLIRDQPVGDQGVPAGATLTVLNKNVQGLER